MKNETSFNKLLNTVCTNIKDLLGSKGLNATTLSIEMNIPRTTINSWLLKKKLPRADYIYMLADFFNVTTDYIYGREI